MKVAVQATTIEETDELPAKSKACTDAGKPAINDRQVRRPGRRHQRRRPRPGRRDVGGLPGDAYAIKQSGGKLEQAGEIFDSAPYGWPVAKGSPLAQALQKALEHLIESGRPTTVATNWGVEAGMIDKPVINGATS